MGLILTKHYFAPGGIGRRLVVLFVLTATVPLSLLAAYTVSRVSSELRAVRQAELIQLSKAYGMSLIGRLHSVENLLRRGAGANDPKNILLAFRSHIDDEFAGVAVIMEGKGIGALGDAAELQTFNPQQEGPAVITRPSGHSVYFAKRADPRHGDVWIVAKLHPHYLWGTRDELPGTADVIVVNQQGSILYQSQAFGAGTAALLRDRLSEGEHRGVASSGEGGPKHSYIGYWQLPPGKLGAGDYLVAAGQSAAHIDAPVQAFNRAFLPIALFSAIAAALLALMHIRRWLRPLDELKSAAIRATKNDFSGQVSAQGSTEFSALGTAFNAMTAQIGDQLSTLNSYADIDRIVLTTLDMSAVAERVLGEVLSSTRAAAAAMYLDCDESELLHRYTLSSARPHMAHKLVDRIGFEGFQAKAEWLDNIAYESANAYAWPGRERFSCGLPIASGSKFLGVLMLSHPSPIAWDDKLRSKIDGLIDRVAIALVAAQRERLLQRQARCDSLTGLPNRRSFLEHLDKSVRNAMQSGGMGSLLFLDLDQFKRANDVLGHLAGDALLKMAAERLQASVRPSDFLARLGGDEFTIVCNDSGGKVETLCASLINHLSQPFDIEGRLVFIGLSIGSVQIPADGENALDLLRRADTAMYHAKKAGGQSHAAFTRDMEKEVEDSLTLDHALRDALEHDRLLLHYQVQVSADGESIIGAEALVRWVLPDGTVRNPLQWIPYAEQTPLIHRVGAWVLATACRQVRLWDDAGLHIDRVAVNITARQIEHEGFYFDVIGALEAAGVAPHRLELEITESQLMSSPEVGIALLRRLSKLGIAIAVDDFGTGYSSFGQLRHLPLSILKVDRSLVCDLDTSEEANAILLAIIQMAHALHFKVIAEGCETHAEQLALQKLGCDAIQGFRIGMPVPGDLFFKTYANGIRKEAGVAHLLLVSSKDSQIG
ncbi:MAG TPA: EAL domain-containing protein [Burkholderiales bacterium]|nr:EAL domain-containing protein [Burkholderiales bacterium]